MERYSLDLGEMAALDAQLRVTEDGPIRAVVRGSSKLGSRSQVEVRYSLWAGVPYLFVDFDLDWRERHRLLCYVVDTGGLTIAAADALFQQPLVVSGGASPGAPPFRLSRLGSLVPSWVLPAEATQGFVVRLHEAMGRAGRAVIELRAEPEAVDVVDFLERPQPAADQLVQLGPTTYELTYRPYDLLGVRVTTKMSADPRG